MQFSIIFLPPQPLQNPLTNSPFLYSSSFCIECSAFTWGRKGGGGTQMYVYYVRTSDVS